MQSKLLQKAPGGYMLLKYKNSIYFEQPDIIISLDTKHYP